jgi:hypothetical protein
LFLPISELLFSMFVMFLVSNFGILVYIFIVSNEHIRMLLLISIFYKSVINEQSCECCKCMVDISNCVTFVMDVLLICLRVHSSR